MWPDSAWEECGLISDEKKVSAAEATAIYELLLPARFSAGGLENFRLRQAAAIYERLTPARFWSADWRPPLRIYAPAALRIAWAVVKEFFVLAFFCASGA
jgi:hypothetical protein